METKNEGREDHEAAIAEAMQLLEEYVKLCGEIYDDIRQDPERYADFQRMIREQQELESKLTGSQAASESSSE